MSAEPADPIDERTAALIEAEQSCYVITARVFPYRNVTYVGVPAAARGSSYENYPWRDDQGRPFMTAEVECDDARAPHRI